MNVWPSPPPTPTGGVAPSPGILGLEPGLRGGRPAHCLCSTPPHQGWEAGPGYRQALAVPQQWDLGSRAAQRDQTPDSRPHYSASQVLRASHPHDPNEVIAGTGCLLGANNLSPGSQPGIQKRVGMVLWAVNLPVSYVRFCTCLCTSRCVLLAHVSLRPSVPLGSGTLCVYL